MQASRGVTLSLHVLPLHKVLVHRRVFTLKGTETTCCSDGHVQGKNDELPQQREATASCCAHLDTEMLDSQMFQLQTSIIHFPSVRRASQFANVTLR